MQRDKPAEAGLQNSEVLTQITVCFTDANFDRFVLFFRPERSNFLSQCLPGFDRHMDNLRPLLVCWRPLHNKQFFQLQRGDSETARRRYT
jgi:hypothetical protein